MRNRKLWCISGSGAVVTLAGLATLALLLKHEPNFYETAVPPAELQGDLSLRALSAFAQMMKDCQARTDKWHCELTEGQLNSFFKEHFPRIEQSKRLARHGISDPVIGISDDEVRVAFRFGSGWFSTIVSYDLQVWLVPKESNTIAVKVLRARAGAVPISSQTVLHRLADFARELNYEVNFYRHEGKSVGIIKLEPSSYNPYWKLTRLKVGPSSRGGTSLLIQGCTADHAQRMPEIKAPNVP